MKILIDCASLNIENPRGVANFSLSMISALSDIHHSIYVVVSNTRDFASGKSYFKNKTNVHFIHERVIGQNSKIGSIILSIFRRILPGFKNIINHLNYIKPLKKYDYDVVFYPNHLSMPRYLGPSVSTIHSILNDYTSEKISTAEKHIVSSNAIITSWPYPFRDLILRYPNISEKLFMVPIVTPIIEYKPQTCWYTDLLNFPKEYYFYPAVMIPRKNHEILIRAMGKLTKEGFNYPAIVFTGGYDNGELTIHLRQLAGSLNVADKFIFLGDTALPQVSELYRNCKGVISSSFSEAGMAVILEGVFYGKPVICSNIPEAVEHANLYGLDVCYFDPKSVVSCAEAIIEFEQNYDYYLESSSRAEAIVKKYSATYMAKCYSEIFEYVSGHSDKPEWFPFKREVKTMNI